MGENRSAGRSHRPRAAGAPAVALALLVACASGPAARAPGEDRAAAAETAAGEPGAEGAVGTAEPAWKLDAQGRRYLVRPLEKRLASRVAPDQVRTTWGVTLDLEREDATHWHYRVYQTPGVRPAPGRATRGAEREEAASAGAAPAPLPTSDALRFERVGGGLPEKGQWRDGFDVADLDGDGELDLAHGPPRKGRPSPRLFLGDGRGGFRLWEGARWPALPYDYGDAEAGDLDGDGDLDLVLASHVRGLVALLGDGRGGFARAGAGLDFAERGAAPFSSRAIELVDFDGDGRLDVLALGEGPRLVPASTGGARAPAAPGAPPDARADAAGAAGAGDRTVVSGAQGLVLYRGLGDGRFERRDQGTGAAQPFGRALAVADFDGDGRLDAATASSQFGRRDLVQRGLPGGGWEAAPIEALPPHAYVLAVAAADLDRDGRAELAIGYAALVGHRWRSGLDVLAGAGDGRWRRTALLATKDALGPQAIATGDLDADGALDLVALDGRGALHVFRGDGRGGFAREARPPGPFPGGCRGAHVAVADLDRDGLGDVVASFAQERTAGAADPACPGEGGLAAWRTLRAR